MKKLLLIPIFLFVSACDANLTLLEDITDGMSTQTEVSAVVCKTTTNVIVTSMNVNVQYQCWAKNLLGNESNFTTHGWYIVPDSAASMTVDGKVTPLFVGPFEVHAQGTNGSDAFVSIQAIQ